MARRAGGDLGLGGAPFVVEPPPVARRCASSSEAEPRIAQLGRGQCRPRGVVGLAPVALLLGPGAELGRQRGGRRFGGLHLGHGAIGLGAGGGAARAGRGRRDPAVSCQRACAASSTADTTSSSAVDFAARLLLGLRRQPARLRPQLGDDVLDPREVRLGLDELLLRAAPAALVAADAGDLLEQRPPLLGPQRERLVDHALADEQERVVGEVRGIEQVDEVAQADPLLVQEVVVLARAIQAPAELEDRELDGQQPVGVVDDERDVGHALGGALLGARPR